MIDNPIDLSSIDISKIILILRGISSVIKEPPNEETASPPLVDPYAMKPQESKLSVFESLQLRKSQLWYIMQELKENTKNPSLNSVSNILIIHRIVMKIP